MTPVDGDFLVLCTDGLTSEAGDAQIARVIAEEANLDRAAERLVRAANGAGGLASLTVMLIRCEQKR